jgi:hypothetical protein
LSKILSSFYLLSVGVVGFGGGGGGGPPEIASSYIDLAVHRMSKVKQWLVQRRGEGCYAKVCDLFCLNTHFEIYTELSTLHKYISPKDGKWNV